MTSSSETTRSKSSQKESRIIHHSRQMSGVDTVSVGHTETNNARARTAAMPASSPTVPRQGASGQRIGPYVLGKTLGVGSTGRVKLGVHMETNQRVAIKIISKEMLDPNVSEAKRAEGTKKLEREITIMKLIHHPHVLQLYDVYETNKELFLVLEMVEGGELFDYLVKKGRLNETEAVGFFQQIIMGVEFCHRHLICHRDLKPENLLLDKDRNVKIADFGMASLQVPSRMLETSCGSPHYASPEIIRGIRYDGPSADIWSCGVILYALVTGNLPFDDENIRRLLNKVKTGLFYIPDYVSPEAKDLIKRMLVVDPAKRISMADIMRHPWFLSRPLKMSSQILPSALDTDALSRCISNAPKLEEDILDSLTLLGWSDKQQLMAALSSKDPNVEKVFYNLLYKRKWDMLEHYDAEKTSQYDTEDGPRRRTESFSQLERPKLNQTQSNDELNTPSDQQNYQQQQHYIPGSSQMTTSGAQRRAVSESHRARPAISSVRVNSPLAASIIPSHLKTEVKADQLADTRSDGTDVDTSINNKKPSTPSPLKLVSPPQSPRDRDIQTPTSPRQQNSTPTLPAIPSTPTSPNNPTNGTPPSSSKKKPLTISIPGGQSVNTSAAAASASNAGVHGSNTELGSKDSLSTPRSPVVTQALMAMGLGTPKFHRKGLNPAEIPATPIISSAPKQSWFQALFNFRPDPSVIVSRKSMEETLQAVLQNLTVLEVKFQLRKDGLVKCKFDPQTLTVPNNGNSTRNSATSPTSLSNHSNNESCSSPLTPQSSHSPHDQVPASPAVTGKAVKFKIEFISEPAKEMVEHESKDIIRIQFTHQQGAFSTFQALVDRFQQIWLQNNPNTIDS